MTGSPFASARRAPTRWWRRGFALVVALVLTIAILWALAIVGLWGYAWFQLGGLDLRATNEEVAALGSVGAHAPPDATTVLVVLTEPRDPTVPREPDLAGPVAIVQAGGGRDTPAVLVLPTDLPVSVEGLGAVSLDEVHSEGGEDLLARAVIDYAEVRLDQVVSLTVDALPRLVESLGAVETCSVTACSRISPQQVREAQSRSSDPEAWVRGMTDTIRGIGQRMDGASVVRSPLTAKRAVDVVASEVRTDASLRGTTLLDLAERFAGVGQPEIDHIPLFHNPETGALVPLEEPAMLRFQRLRDGSPLVVAEEDRSLEELVTGTVEVAILNGAGVAGLAASIQGRLETDGFRVIGTGNAPSFGRTDTVVAYGPEPATTEAAAVVLAENLGGAQLEALERAPTFEGEPVDVLITVGTDLDDTES